ncbi:hypothetical protein TNCT_32091 [Trichonephila clavata]|uniref:Uncharacterized protein n=1 Tax=Trichonephila clavata TaxID=2740835 RepID=A0A8X6GMG0_TRICU|nr:hypothetical protein TNCT_32091 [Trichonephila clavata]
MGKCYSFRLAVACYALLSWFGLKGTGYLGVASSMRNYFLKSSLVMPFQLKATDEINIEDLMFDNIHNTRVTGSSRHSTNNSSGGIIAASAPEIQWASKSSCGVKQMRRE